MSMGMRRAEGKSAVEGTRIFAMWAKEVDAIVRILHF